MNSYDNEVVVYAALDKEFSEPILNQVGEELAVAIRTKFDVESNKTVGLVTDLIQHRNRPRADIFWNNEILHTIRLQQMGLLETWIPEAASVFPSEFRASDGSWTGFAARARVFLVNIELLPDETEHPNSFFDLAAPKWSGKCGMAKPFFGTSATHAAVMFDRLGVGSAKRWFREIASNAVIEGGNRQVAIRVGRGELMFGLTDTDDAMLEIDKGSPVAIVFPDQLEGESGTLLIPNTICLIRNGPNTERAKQVIDRILQPAVESALAEGTSAQIPLNPSVDGKCRLKIPDSFRAMEVDFESAAKQWDEVALILQEVFRR